MSLESTQPSVPATPGGPGPGSVPVVAAAPRARSGGILNLLLIGATIVAIGGVAFAIGRSTAPGNALTQVGAFPDGAVGIGPRGSFAPSGAGPGGFAFSGAPSMDGTVAAIDDDSITLTLDNGEEVTLKLDAATTFRESTEASPGDVAVGNEVTVKLAGDGRITAGAGGQAPALTAGDVTVAR